MALPKFYADLDTLLGTHPSGRLIRSFAPEAQQVFFDQVARRYPREPDVAAHIKGGGVQSLNSFIEAVVELLAKHPFTRFSPPILAGIRDQGTIFNYVNGLRSRLAYPPTSVVYDHVYQTLIRYNHIQSDREGDLLVLVGGVGYHYNRQHLRAPINVFLPMSYPSARPHVSIICPDGVAINPDHINIDPNGQVRIPYIVNWDEQSSDLVQLLSHLCVEFTCQPPLFEIAAVGMTLSSKQKKLLSILLDYQIRHLYKGFQDLTPLNKSEFFREVYGRYPQVSEVDLPEHIRTAQDGLKNFFNIVAEILKLPSWTRGSVDVADLPFLP